MWQQRGNFDMALHSALGRLPLSYSKLPNHIMVEFKLRLLSVWRHTNPLRWSSSLRRADRLALIAFFITLASLILRIARRTVGQSTGRDPLHGTRQLKGLADVMRRSSFKDMSTKKGKCDGDKKKSSEELLRVSFRLCFAAMHRAEEKLMQTGERYNEDLDVSCPHATQCKTAMLARTRFAYLREIWGLSEDCFWSSLCNFDLQASGKSGGKSDSEFWFSGDKRFVLKSIDMYEMKSLIDGLGAYTRHFEVNRNSLLSRFFAAFSIKVGERTFRLVVMSNILATSGVQPHVVYDLKGTTEDRWVRPSPGAVQKDLNFADQVIGVSDSRIRADLLHAIRCDTRFLRDQNIMDYSMLLGIHYCDDQHSPAEVLAPPPGLSSSLGVARGFEPVVRCTLVRGDTSARRVVYMIGIIDILQRYDSKKFVAHVVKSLSLGLFHEIDSVPPVYYARRFKTMLLGKVQTFREPGDRVARFVHRLQAGIGSGAIPRPMFAVLEAPNANPAASADMVTMDESIDFAVRCGGHLHLLRRPRWNWLRSRWEEVEAFLDMDRHALVFQTLSRDVWGRKRTSAVACYKIRRVYLSIVCPRTRDRYCTACKAQMGIEAEPIETRRFTVEADETPLRFTAPSRRQAKLWVTALEVAAAYAEANVEDAEDTSVLMGCMASPKMPFDSCCRVDFKIVEHVLGDPFASGDVADKAQILKFVGAMWAAIAGSLEAYLHDAEFSPVLAVGRSARMGMLEPYLMGPEAERRWEKRRVKWIFGFVDTDGVGMLNLAKVRTLWQEMNINEAEGQQVLSRFLKDAREGRRAGGGRQIGSGRLIYLADFRRMLLSVDLRHARSVRNSLISCGFEFDTKVEGRRRFSTGNVTNGTTPLFNTECNQEETTSPEELARFFARVQQVVPPPSAGQVRRLLARLDHRLLAPRTRYMTPTGLAQFLCSPSNNLVEPMKRSVYQDMTQPLSAYFIESSHNTYLEGHQLSSRSSVFRYVEVLRSGCRSVEIDVWDGCDGEPVVKHGYTVTTEVFFEDVIDAIADHAFVASEYPVVLSIEQHCSALQRTRQGEILMKVLGDRLLRPPWDEVRNDIDYDKFEQISPWSARGRFLVKSERGCCERCKNPLPVYDRCIALPSIKLCKREKIALQGGEPSAEEEDEVAVEPRRQNCHVSSMTGRKVLKLRDSAGQATLRRWNARYLTRAYPEATRIGSGNIDPMPLWQSGVQMVALNYQTNDQALMLNEGLFRSCNGGCGYILKNPELRDLDPPELRKSRAPRRVRIRICCGHRLLRPEAPPAESDGSSGAGRTLRSTDAAACSPVVSVALEPGGHYSQSKPVALDGYHPVFNHEVEFAVSDAPFHILTFDVRDASTSRQIGRRAVSLDAVREGFRWLPLYSSLGNTIRHGGLLVYVEFLPTAR